MGISGGILKSFFTLTPMLLVGVLAAYNRVAPPDYNTPEYGSAIGKRISAYSEPVGLIRNVLLCKEDQPKTADVIAVGELWVRLHDAGELAEIPRVSSESGGSDGVRDQILNAKGVLVHHLIRVSDLSRRNGDLPTAKLTAELAFRSAQVMKFSDLNSLNLALSEENSALRRLVGLGVAIHTEPVSKMQVERLLASDFRAVLSSGKWSEAQRGELQSNFTVTLAFQDLKRSQARGETGYALIMLAGQLKRIKHLCDERAELIAKLPRPSVVAQAY